MKGFFLLGVIEVMEKKKKTRKRPSQQQCWVSIQNSRNKKKGM